MTNRRLPTWSSPEALDCPHRPAHPVWNTKDGPSVRVCRMNTSHLHRALGFIVGRMKEVDEERRTYPFAADYAHEWVQKWYDAFVAELTARNEIIPTYIISQSHSNLIVDAEMLDTEPTPPPSHSGPQGRPLPPRPRRPGLPPPRTPVPTDVIDLDPTDDGATPP